MTTPSVTQLLSLRCELLSKFLSLTDWWQPEISVASAGLGCELLSKFLSLTDWWQQLGLSLYEVCGCELLSKFLSLTDWWQLYAKDIPAWGVVNCFRNFYLWQTDDNIFTALAGALSLWIAFEIFIFDRLMTTSYGPMVFSTLLWIAFEIFIFDRLMTTADADLFT